MCPDNVIGVWQDLRNRISVDCNIAAAHHVMSFISGFGSPGDIDILTPRRNELLDE